MSEFLTEVFGTTDAALDQWYLIRAELQTRRYYSEPEIYRCDSSDFYSYTNPIWLKINSSNNSTVYSQNLDFKVFPNPANGSVEIELSSGTTNGNVSIFNSVGQVVFCENIYFNAKVKIDNLQPGIYFVRMESEHGRSSKKLVIY